MVAFVFSVKSLGRFVVVFYCDTCSESATSI